MENELVTLGVRDGVAVLTLNRPRKRNALSRALLAQFSVALQRVESDETVRVLLLKAAGPVFCAGMDLAEMQETAALPHAAELWMGDTRIYREVIGRLFSLSIPTVAVVNGPAVAGGLGLVLACDLVVAAENATFALPEPKRGITAAVVTPVLVYRVGNSQASYLLLSGRAIDAARAREIGLCHDVVPGDRLDESAQELAVSVLSGAPAALAISKRQLRSCSATDVLRQLEEAATVSARARETADAREGLQAFLVKRPPQWQPPLPTV
jgi:methylglutaconyl-CoA hydratase